jgi:hypothetical protein
MQHRRDDDLNRQGNNSTTGGRSKADGAKEAWQRAEPFPIAADPSKIKVAVWKASQCRTQLEAALIYAEHGIPVLPCNWKYNDEGVLSKYPMVFKPGVYLATIDPITVQRWWTQWPEALIGVPGGWVTGIWYLDVDSKEHGGPDGMEAWYKLEVTNQPTIDTRSHKTGTNGVHYIFLENPNRPMGCKKGNLPKGIDPKGDGGYVIFPPSPYERNGVTVRYDVSIDSYPASAPAWLYDLILGARPTNTVPSTSAHGSWEWSPGFGEKKLEEICETVRTAIQHEWDAARRKVFFFGRLVSGGAYDVDKAWGELEQAAKECEAPEDYPGEVKRAFFNGVKEPVGPFVEENVSFNDFCAYLPQHQYIFIPTRELWPAASVNSRITSIDSKLKANLWLDKNRCVEQMTWAPGEEMLIHGRLISEGGWIEKNGVSCFNLYRPPTIEPGDASKAGPWLDHVQKVFGDDAEHIIKWCAQRVQHPEIKINHALLLGSEKQGVGKDAMLEPVKRAVGPWNFGEVGPQQLLGRFNGFLKRTILRVSEVRDLGDINRYQFYEHTKAITAAPPDALRVDEKHLQEHSVLNCVGLILTTNYKTSGIYLPAEDRRHYVAWSHVTPGDFPDGYWNRLWGWYDTGGDRHVAGYLAGLDLLGWDPKVPPPKTEAFWDIVDANRAPEDTQLADILDEMGNPKAVSLRDVINKIKNSKVDTRFAVWLDDPKNRRIIPHRFEKCGYVPVRNPDRVDRFWKIRGQRQVVYALSGLSLQEQLQAAGWLALST